MPTQFREIETTAYCSCGRCCGWEWGAALGSLPLYINLTCQKRASGFVAIPLLPRRRRELPHHPSTEAPPGWQAVDRLRGAALGAAIGLASMVLTSGTRSRLLPRSTRHGWGDVARGLQMSGQWRGGVGAVVGGLATPVSRYWAETNLAGYPYVGTTSTGVQPREPLPPLLSMHSLRNPLNFMQRLVLLQWRMRDGTIAADTSVYPFDTRMFIEGYGWGKVEDRGGAIKGSARIDLYHADHEKALAWGRKKKLVKVQWRT